LIPDFTRYSLALLEGDKLIHSSTKSGLRPLWDALTVFCGKSGLVLHDKVVGLAAARLIVHSGMIAKILTGVASLPARQFLGNTGIALCALDIVDNILTKDQSAVCPGELIALGTSDQDAFIQKIRAMLK